MDRSVKDIPSLITWLADKHHRGAASAMSARLGVSVSTPSFWKRGVVMPKHENLERICAVYGLDPDEVWKLARRSMRRKAEEGWKMLARSRKERRRPELAAPFVGGG
jgi:transcriptional regulator with XRE-family HTH domain